MSPTSRHIKILPGLVTLLFPATAWAGTTIYVNAAANGANTGVRWADAFNDLQMALDTAAVPDSGITEIWVACGVYRPSKRTEPADPRSATFQLLSGVAIYGGFAGGEQSRDERNPAEHMTVLSGDLQGDDTWIFEGQFQNPTKTNNAYHVVTGSVDASAVLDGFTITAGYAKGSGGGMYNMGGCPTVRNCTFLSNLAFGEDFARGGGMYNEDADPTLTDCTFIANDVGAAVPGAGDGGGMANLDGRPTLIRCMFYANTAVGNDGGGIWNCNDELTLVQCAFYSNSARRYGGALATDCGKVTAVQCTFSENSTVGGGAIYNAGELTLTHCDFRLNGAGGFAGKGGAVLNNGSFSERAKLTLSNCTFRGNGSNGGGGAIHTSQGLLDVAQCTFVGNGASQGSEGNALACESRGEQAPSVIRIANCILWDRVEWSDADEIWNGDGSTIAVTYSDVWDGWAGEGNLNADPRFVDLDGLDGTPGTEDDDLRLRPSSPCIDSGDNSAVPADTTDLDGDGDTTEPLPSDLAGNPRFIDDPATANTGRGAPPLVDMGALESTGGSAPPPRLYVDANATGANNGTSWADAFTDLQPALDLAYWGGTVREVWVAGGTYRPSRRTDPDDQRSATFQLLSGVALYGGFAGGEEWLEQRTLGKYPSVLTGDLTGDDDGVDGRDPTRWDNAYHVVTGTHADATASIDGFVVSGGNSNGSDAAGGSIGEAVGGGMINDLSGSPTVTRCVFRDNSAGYGGAGMYNGDGSHLLVAGCVFIGNVVTGDYGTGGAMLSFESYPTVVNSTFTANRAPWDPENCRCGAGGIASDEGITTVVNSIVWGNTGQQVTGSEVSYSCVEGGAEGTANTDADPLFADADGLDDVVGTADDDLRLRPGSPSIDAGSESAVPPSVTTDLAGHSRVRGRHVDLGAYEAGLPMDSDMDEDIDAQDLISFQVCWSGPMIPRAETPGCKPADSDGDNDVDQADFGVFQRCYSGASKPADPNCAN